MPFSYSPKLEIKVGLLFAPSESPSIYAWDGGNRKHQLIIEGWVKALFFLTEFI
jgi:hypothetical protein